MLGRPNQPMPVSMKPALALLALLLVPALALAEGPRSVPPEVLAAITDDEPIIPKHLTIQEKGRHYLPDLSRLLEAPPPAQLIETLAEYQYNEGLLLRWGQFNSVVTEITVAVTTGDPEARIFLIVSGPSQQSDAVTALTGAGADLSQVEFLQMPSNTVWIRDYGPRFINADWEGTIIDHEYNRPRPNDNLVPANLGSQWNVPVFELPLNHGGGNFHLFANGQAFMTDLIVDENPGFSEQQIIDLYDDYHNLELYLLPALPFSYDSTQHLDMWFLPVDNQTVIIGEYAQSEGGGIPRQVTEFTTDLMEDLGYTVLRTPGWRTNAHYTYTNSVVINSLVLICRFNGYPAENQAAIDVYQAAFPNRTVVTIDCSSIITASGAIHCIVKHVPRTGVDIFTNDFDA